MRFHEVKLGTVYRTMGGKLVRALRKRARDGNVFVGTVAIIVDGKGRTSVGWTTDAVMDWYHSSLLSQRVAKVA